MIYYIIPPLFFQTIKLTGLMQTGMCIVAAITCSEERDNIIAVGCGGVGGEENGER